MITIIFAMGAQGWVTFPLCCSAATRFLEAGGLLLEILIFVGQFFTIATSSSLVQEILVLLDTSCSSTDFSLVAAVARLSKYPYRSFMPTSSLLLFVTT